MANQDAVLAEAGYQVSPEMFTEQTATDALKTAVDAHAKADATRGGSVNGREAERKYRAQIQDGLQAKECLEYLRPMFEIIRRVQLDRLTVSIPQERLQDHLLDCRAQAIGCKAIEDALKGRINTGKLAESY